MPESTTRADHAALLKWYRENRRSLPWRANRDPYRIWVSEVMLQQTTVAAVVPYYEKFLKLFPDVGALANAPEGDVLKAWAGLGYYSRARNLHKAAKALAEKGFPKTAAELLDFPGFGPYTAAAVASIAFDDPSGVLDGNVIRVLSRRYGWDSDWWTTVEKKKLQAQSDAFAAAGSPSEINQAMMELGATVCTPKSPACLLCPWAKSCEARRRDAIAAIPKPKPRKSMETWLWSPVVHRKKDRVALIVNESAPVLKGQFIFPGAFKRIPKKPKTFDARHGITHHDIFVRVAAGAGPAAKGVRWVDLSELETVNPSKLLRKVLDAADRKS